LRDLKGVLNLEVIDEDGKRVRTDTAGKGSLLGIRYYEQFAGERVKEFLGEHFDRYDPSHPSYLSRYNQLLPAEQALAAVLRFPQSAREREVRKGEGWDAVEEPLHAQLLGVLLAQMDELAAARSWEPAFGLAHRVVDTFT